MMDFILNAAISDSSVTTTITYPMQGVSQDRSRGTACAEQGCDQQFTVRNSIEASLAVERSPVVGVQGPKEAWELVGQLESMNRHLASVEQATAGRLSAGDPYGALQVACSFGEEFAGVGRGRDSLSSSEVSSGRPGGVVGQAPAVGGTAVGQIDLTSADVRNLERAEMSGAGDPWAHSSQLRMEYQMRLLGVQALVHDAALQCETIAKCVEHTVSSTKQVLNTHMG